MIDEYWTWEFYGYHSDELKPHSSKPIVARCDECCQYRILQMNFYSDLCRPCAVTHIPPHTDKTKLKISKSQRGKKKGPFSEEHCRNLSKGCSGRKMPLLTEEHKRNISAGHQCIPYEEWTEFIGHKKYCKLFDEACRERVRAKYGYRCFICDRPQDQNITKSEKVHKLSVHHVDRNRQQGCDGVQWKLVPLCIHCHPGSHNDPMKSRIEYLLNN